MTKNEIVDWIRNNYLPIQLATATETMEQHVDTTIRYWNTHSAYSILRNVDVSYTDKFKEVPTDIKTVVEVMPNDFQDDYFANHPMYILLGYVTLDRFTQDFILISNTYEAYRRFLNADFKWNFQRTEDPAVGGTIYFQNIPRAVTKMTINGLKRILPEEDIKDEHILEWILEYSRALVEISEGVILRKSGMIGIQNDGTDLVQEGTTKVDALQERLRQEARWAVLATRI